MTKNVAQMEERRRTLDREIRAAKRAEANAEKERRLSAQQALGVWLAQSMGADTPEAVAALREVLVGGSFLDDLRQQIGVDSPDMSQADDDAALRESSDSEAPPQLGFE